MDTRQPVTRKDLGIPGHKLILVLVEHKEVTRDATAYVAVCGCTAVWKVRERQTH
ncbi:hypothetical protein GCM10010341_91090 [Streptomyces noursei]|nr:hypothetical protein GCM10010341_91090 [Streptomyces noursei]